MACTCTYPGMQAQATMRKAARAKEDPEEEGGEEDPDQKWKDEAKEDDPPNHGTRGRGRGRGKGKGKGRGRAKKQDVPNEEGEKPKESEVIPPGDQKDLDAEAQPASPKPRSKKRKAEQPIDTERDQKGDGGVANEAASPEEGERESVEEKEGASPSSINADSGEVTPKKMPKKRAKKTPLKGMSPSMIKGALEQKVNPKD